MQSESITEGATMTTVAQRPRELAHRSTNGIDVRLFWSHRSDRVSIELVDSRTNKRVEFDVPPKKALDAFNHPYAYAPKPTCDLVTTRAVVQR
jgi:hypothetical protein